MKNKPIRAYEEFNTNIIGLPEGEYLTETMWSDNRAFKVVAKTAATMTLKKVKVRKNPEWKPEIIPGGFAGHCTNQNEQTWVYDGLESDTIKVRLVKSKYAGSEKLWGRKGSEFIANGAVEFYDYNF